eukprot:925695-Pleurochrysis_carterae.AAC.1
MAALAHRFRQNLRCSGCCCRPSALVPTLERTALAALPVLLAAPVSECVEAVNNGSTNLFDACILRSRVAMMRSLRVQ